VEARERGFDADDYEAIIASQNKAADRYVGKGTRQIVPDTS